MNTEAKSRARQMPARQLQQEAAWVTVVCLSGMPADPDSSDASGLYNLRMHPSTCKLQSTLDETWKARERERGEIAPADK